MRVRGAATYRQRMTLWSRRLRHLASPKLFWASALLLAVTAAVIWPPHAKQEACIRWWGMVLQFVGIYSVVRELRTRREDVGAPGLVEALRKFIKGWPSRNTTISLEGASISIASSVARVTQRACKVPPDSPLEQRLAAVERNLGFMDEDLGKLQSDLDTEVRERQTAVRDEQDERVRVIAAMKNSLKESTTKTLPFSMFGVVCLFAGVGLSSMFVELARWIPLLFK